MFAACKDKKEADNRIITTDYEAPKPQAPIASAASVETHDVKWVEGRHYMVTIMRTAVDSLPMVSNANGQKYIDNAIKLKVARADSTLFYTKTFTKKSFANWLDSDYREKAILEGISILETDDSSMSFIAWLNYPDAGDDEAVELRLTLDAQGNMGIQRFTYDDRDDLIIMDEE